MTNIFILMRFVVSSCHNEKIIIRVSEYLPSKIIRSNTQDVCRFSCKTRRNKHVVPRPRGFNPDSSSAKSITRLFFYFRLGHLCCETRLTSLSTRLNMFAAAAARRFIENSSKLLNDETWRSQRKSLCHAKTANREHNMRGNIVRYQYLPFPLNIINCRIYRYCNWWIYYKDY